MVEETEEERREETDTDLEEDADLSEKDAEIDRLKAEIAEKDAEIDRLRQELEDAQANAKSDTDNEVLNMVNNAGGIEWLKKFQSKGKIDKRTTESNNLEKAEAKKTEKLTFAEYRKLDIHSPI